METVLVVRDVNNHHICKEYNQSFIWNNVVYDHNQSSDSDFTDDEGHVSAVTDDSGHESSCHSDESVYFSDGSESGGESQDFDSSGFFDSEGCDGDDNEFDDENGEEATIVVDNDDLDFNSDDIEDPFNITNINQSVVVERVFREDILELETHHTDEYMKRWFHDYFNTSY